MEFCAIKLWEKTYQLGMYYCSCSLLASINKFTGDLSDIPACVFERVYAQKHCQVDDFVDTSTMISVLDGYNVCIYVYGLTGSGKTFTWGVISVMEVSIMRLWKNSSK